LTDSISAADYLATTAKARHEPKAKAEFRQWLNLATGVSWVDEFIFHPTRKWRFDWATDPAESPLQIAVEYDGLVGVASFGKQGEASNVGHASIGGILRDSEKINEAQILGWIVIRVNAKSIGTGEAHNHVLRAIEFRRNESHGSRDCGGGDL
jgi:hypothetical protein